MAVRAFTFDRPSTDLFIRLGYDVNRHDPAWIPPLRTELEAQLAPELPFHSRPGNDHRRFLALAGGRPLARCLASVNRDLADRDGTPVGAIGFFESENEYAAAGDVLSAAADWLRDKHGLKRVWGPLNFDIWHGYRLMTRGFEQQRFLGEPQNPAYYPDFFDRSGFSVRQRWNTFELPGPEALERLAAKGGAEEAALLQRGYRMEPFDADHFEENVDLLHSILSRSFSGFLGYTPIAKGEFRGLMSVARYALHARCSTFVYDEHGALAGFAGVFRDLGGAVCVMKGSDGWIARLRFLMGQRRAKRLLLHIGGITPEEARKRNGTARGMFTHVVRKLRAEARDGVLATLIAKGNPVRRLYGECAADDRREYALYQKDL